MTGRSDAILSFFLYVLISVEDIIYIYLPLHDPTFLLIMGTSVYKGYPKSEDQWSCKQPQGRGRQPLEYKNLKTSSPKGNDAHLRATIQSEKKWKDKFFRRLRAANCAVCGRIWPNFKLFQAIMYVIITCKYEKDPIKNYREKLATTYFKL